MGLLVDGEWVDQWYDTSKSGGSFERPDAVFRHWIKEGGEFPPEAGRYHLYVSLACPWAHRTLIFRQLKALTSLIDVTVVHPDMLENGWEFAGEPEPLYGFQYAYQLYTKANPYYTGRVTVPILWDKKKQTIVSNESADIIRMMNTAFVNLAPKTKDYYPLALQGEIDGINDYVYEFINNGVYRCGFATTQQAYELAYDDLFAALDKLELRLTERDYLLGSEITEADWRLFTTLIRFDAVYYAHFKCNKKRIADYPQLSRFVADLYGQPGIASTVNIEQIKRHYYFSQTSINPTQIVPKGLPAMFVSNLS
ncbi:MAG: glutathione-dependent reductase [Zetaproteobacteria bacterium CG2_30_46_52]|nr:MAG: glutathione-dependent reductase [Zetaproteobacteria bacterium CG2_30_46_52]